MPTRPTAIEISGQLPPTRFDAPRVIATDQTFPSNTDVAAQSLFTVVDPQGDVITKYQLTDYSAGGGYWIVDGAPVEGTMTVTAAQLEGASFHIGGVGSVDHVGIRAFDGAVWGVEKQFDISAPAVNQAPVATGLSFTLARNTMVDATQTFTASDADGHITTYVFRDDTADAGSGHWVFKGDVQSAGVDIEVAASELSSMRWQAGSTPNGVVDQVTVTVRDNDGATATAHSVLTTAKNQIPTLDVEDVTLVVNQHVKVSTLVKYFDPDSDAPTIFALSDKTTGGGHFELDGEVLGLNGALSYEEFSPEEFARLEFVAGGTSGTDLLSIRVYDGMEWSSPWDDFKAFTVAPAAPDLFTL